MAKLDALQSHPRPRGARKIEGGRRGELRLRVGDYRVIYVVQDEALRVVVVAIGPRNNVYRRH